jgi:hypothetical protein
MVLCCPRRRSFEVIDSNEFGRSHLAKKGFPVASETPDQNFAGRSPIDIPLASSAGDFQSMQLNFDH